MTETISRCHTIPRTQPNTQTKMIQKLNKQAPNKDAALLAGLYMV
jgi:sulfur relay (sulfurtransferase) DsrC/TusE family protein